MTISYLTDRSRILALQSCPRSRYWQYEFSGRGLHPIQRRVELSTGGSIHKGLETLLIGGGIEPAVSAALTDYRQTIEGGGLLLEPNENILYVIAEQSTLIEGLVRTFYLRGLSELLSKYRVIAVEQEIPLDLADNLRLMTRADGLLQDLESGDLYVLSFKTANIYDRRLANSAAHDVQGLSEIAALQKQLGKWWEDWQMENDFDAMEDCIGAKMAQYIADCADRPQVVGVQMVYLLKGKRAEYPEDSGLYYQNSPLVRPWFKEGITSYDDAYYWKYKWTDPRTGKGRSLSYNSKRVPIWEKMQIADWVSLLDQGRIQSDAGDPLATFIVAPPPYARRPQEIDDWIEQITNQEDTVANSSYWAQRLSADSLHSALNRDFPQYRKSCDWPSACPYQKLCFTPMGSDPLGSGQFKLREPHHSEEVLKFKELDSNE